MFIDTHAHLNFPVFNSDLGLVINRAQKVGIGAIINIGSDLKSSKKAIEIAEKFSNCYAAAGLHPIHLKEEQFNEAEFLRLAKHKKVVAIGETGLDYYHDKTFIRLQKEVFQRHIVIANLVNKPLIIHSRDADDDILPFLISQNLKLSGVFHCFPGDLKMANLVLDLGFYLSFTGLITFSKNYANLEVVKEVSLEKIMIETDCPYLTPEPYRGQRNEPAYVVEVAQKIAEIRKITLSEIEKQTSQNALDLFGLKL